MAMTQRVRVTTPEGQHEYLAYNDNRMISADYASGVIVGGSELLYNNMVCEVIGDFADNSGARHCILLFKNLLTNVMFMEVVNG